jgi:hypothetical protein
LGERVRTDRGGSLSSLGHDEGRGGGDGNGEPECPDAGGQCP